MLWSFFTFAAGAILGSVSRQRFQEKKIDTLSQETLHKQDLIVQAAAERSALLKEVHHRVKNNLQVILSIFNLQVRRLGDSDVKRTLQEATNRIQVIAVLHQTLYQSESFSDIDVERYFSEISRFLIGGIVDNKQPTVSLTCSIPPVSIDRAIPLGLILTELITNSIKYAWPPSSQNASSPEKKPEIAISLETSANSPDVAEFTYIDNGAGLEDSFDIHTASSLGSKLIVILTKQLKGSIHIDPKSKSGGVRATFQFPLSKNNSYTLMEKNYAST